MNFQSSRVRRVGRDACRIGAVLSAAMLVIGAAALLDSGRPPAFAAAVLAGEALITQPPGGSAGQPLASGGSTTPFSIAVPPGGACAGDSASGGYRVMSYVVPVSVDPSTLVFQASPAGPFPLATGASFRQPLFLTTKLRYTSVTTGVATTPGGPGPVASSPALDFSYLGPTATSLLPVGVYNVGLACSPGGGTATSIPINKYWNVQMTFVATPSDPGGISWSVGAPVVDTTTTTTTAPGSTTTTTVSGSTTTTSVAGSTTTTSSSVPGVTTTTRPPLPGVTTTTLAVGATTSSSSTTSSTTSTTVVGSGAGTGSGSSSGGTGGSPSGGSYPGSSGTLPSTGSSPMALVVWGILFVVFGRMAILLGRKPRIV